MNLFKRKPAPTPPQSGKFTMSDSIIIHYGDGLMGEITGDTTGTAFEFNRLTAMTRLSLRQAISLWWWLRKYHRAKAVIASRPLIR